MTLVQTSPKAIKIGTTDIKAVYLGETKVRPEAQPITTAGIYRNQTDGLISLSSDGSTWLTIADKNLGATTVYSSGATMSESNCGKFYQWGNCYGFPFTGATSTSSSSVNTSSYGPSNYYSSSTFITYSNWDYSNNADLWGDTTDTDAARKGPCSEGWHIPTRAEMLGLGTLGNSLGVWNFADGSGQGGYGTDKYLGYLKIPLAGGINENNSVFNRDTAAYLYTSSTYYISRTSTLTAYRQMSYSSRADQPSNDTRGRAYNIRPFKNDAVQPDTSWTVIYQ